MIMLFHILLKDFFYLFCRSCKILCVYFCVCIFLSAETVGQWPLLLSPIFYFVWRYLDSNPESCRSKQARYQLSHPSP